MGSGACDDVVVSPAELEDFCAVVLEERGAAPEAAREVARHLVEANLMGHDSHGVGMLPQYCSNIERGGCCVTGSPTLVREQGAVLVMDGGRLLGQVALRQCVAKAAEVARRHGVCALTVRSLHHIGRVGAYAEQAAALGLASVFFVNINDHSPIVAPFGGADSRGSTNPISMGLPRPASTGAGDVVLDFATSVWPMGKARVAFARSQQLPEGVVLDADGKPTTDPAVMFPGATRGGAYTLGMKDSKMGSLVAFGQHKGAGLNLFCELFAALAGGGTSAASSAKNAASSRQDFTLNNVFCLLVDPAALAAEGWDVEVEEMLRFWAASPPAPGARAVRLPGETERRTQELRRAGGIPLEGTTWQKLLELGRGRAVPPRAVARRMEAPADAPAALRGLRPAGGALLVALLAAATFSLGFAVGRRRSR